MLKKINKKDAILLIISIIAIIVFFTLTSVQPLNAKVGAIYDDNLMIYLADNIIQGKWLGEYSNMTLIKGVFTPIFIAILYFFKTPFLTGQMIFYLLAIICFILTIKKIVKNKYILLLIFLYLLYNPIMYSTELCRAYRDGIYTSLIIFFISSIIGIFINRNENCFKLLKYFILLGFSFSAIYLCREETIWLMPFLIIATLITVGFVVRDKTIKNKIKKILLYLIPISIFVISISTVCFLNYKYYGVFSLNQYWSIEFKEAYGALTRINSDTKKDKVPVTKDALAKAYKISPTFAKLEEYFKLTEFNWSICGDGEFFEIQGGWFHWALMNGADYLGYYENANKANEFYQKIADEINEACDKGLVECLPYKRVSNVCRFGIKEILHTVTKMPNTIKYQYLLKEAEFKIPKTLELGNEEIVEKYKNITNEEISKKESYRANENKFRLNSMKIIHKVYVILNSIIFYNSIFMYLIIVIKFIKDMKCYYSEFLILSGLLVLYLCRIFIITFTTEFMWTSATNTMYMSNIYPIQYIFSILSIYFGLKNLKNIEKSSFKGLM